MYVNELQNWLSKYTQIWITQGNFSASSKGMTQWPTMTQNEPHLVFQDKLKPEASDVVPFSQASASGW